MMDHFASNTRPSAIVRGILVVSSVLNGLRNVMTSCSEGFYDIGLFDMTLAITSVLWWREANDRRLLALDRMAIATAFFCRAYHIERCSEATNIWIWLAPGVTLVVTSYLMKYFSKWGDFSYVVWVGFHIVQTQENSVVAEKILASCDILTCDILT